jgi:hypothetical protein
MITKKCERCGQEFQTYPNRIKKGQGRFCSKSCARGNAPISCTCVVCGKSFIVNSCISTGRKYCSRSCMASGKTTSVLCTCKACGIEFKISVSSKSRGEGIFCSRSCCSSYLSGDNHPNWNGGKSFEPYCPRFNLRAKEKVRNLFDRRCVLCGASETSGKHKVHHIDYNKMQGCKGKPWNLVPLCASCHSKTNYTRWYWFSLLSSYWVLNPDINIRRNTYIL